MIHENLNVFHPQRNLENVVVDPNTRYNMGTSQKFPVHILTFLQRNEGDPAIKVRMPISSYLFPLMPLAQYFLPKLKSHLLCHVQAMLEQETRAFNDFYCVPMASDPGHSADLDETACDFIFFKSDCIYHHKLLRFNFMTYAMWWILGTYHANVVYTGPGMHDYKACHFDFLWVQ